MAINLNKAKAVPAPKSSGFVPSPAQQDYFDWVETGTGNCIIEAVAGAGKTTTILHGVAKMEGRVWFGVYNKKMADEIKDKVARSKELCDREGLYVSTFHSAGLSALRFAYRNQYRLEVDAKKVKNIVRRTAGVSEELMLLAGSVPDIVSMAKNRGIGPCIPDTDENWMNMIIQFNLGQGLPEEYDEGTLISYCRQVLEESNATLDVIDFDDMVYLPLALNLTTLKHDWVIVDEAQDTNPTRRALAQRLLAPGGRFVAVGDPCQAIFGFTGADNDSLQQLGETFDCVTLPLTVTYRCPKAVVRVARQVVSHITAHESAPMGHYNRVDVEEFKADIRELDPSDYGQTAILCRLNAPLVSMCFDFIRRDIPARIEGRDVGEGLVKLCQRFNVAKLDGLEEKLETFYEKQMKKAQDKDDDNWMARIEDEQQTMKVLIENTRAKGQHTVAALVNVIKSLFSDDVSKGGILTLCSAHRSKGLEWNRVYLFGRNRYMPNKWAVKDWEIEQEHNLVLRGCDPCHGHAY
jgi:DNA helicase-2/ATP-dependent DNA helicase PcrA